MTQIENIEAREILDSRGNPTIETTVYSKNDKASASVPSGASTGQNEALELRDNTDRYHGKGVREAISNVENRIKKEITGMDCTKTKEIDKKMLKVDGTSKKENLGANAILSVSLASARLAAREQDKHLYQFINDNLFDDVETGTPSPFSNILNGGDHAGNDLSIQEFMVVPQLGNIRKNVRAISEIYHELKNILKSKYGPASTNVGDEGGFAPSIDKTNKALEVVTEAIENSGYKNNEEIEIALDAAATEFYENGKYRIDGNKIDSDELLQLYLNMLDKYPILSIEDPFHEEDFESFKQLNEKTEAMIVGDDLLVTNTDRIEKAIQKNSCDSLLLKVNQIGTLTEAINSAKMSYDNNWEVIVSHRSGETTDTFISDLAVALNSFGIKTGAPARGERTVKYNRLLRIEETL